MSSLSVKHFPLISRSKNAALKQPKEIASYSRNINGEYLIDDSSLLYYFLPDSDVGLGLTDLGGGIKDFQKFDESRDGEFDGFLKSIELYERETAKKLAVDIITWRGIMTKLLTLPYDNRDQLDFKIVKFDGQIFIQIDKDLDMQKRKLEELSMSLEQRKAIYGGYKFELISTLDKPWPECTRKEIEGRSKQVVNNIEQYGSVVKTGIGKVKYCISGEVDCCWDYKPSLDESKEGDDPLGHYVELKTTKVISNLRQAANFNKKLYKTWAQCFLLGIKRIIYGFRDDNMILRSVEEFQTEQIPVLIKLNEQYIQDLDDSKQKNKFMGSLKFLSAVLEFIVDNITEDNTSWRLNYNPRLNKDYLNLSQITDPAVVDHDITHILPQEFRDWRSNELPNI